MLVRLWFTCKVGIFQAESLFPEPRDDWTLRQLLCGCLSFSSPLKKSPWGCLQGSPLQGFEPW